MLREHKYGKPGESGIALIMVLGVLAVLLILAVTFAFNMRLEQRAARNYLDYMAADFHAKAGLDHAVAALRSPSTWLLEERLELGEEATYVEDNFEYTIIPQGGRLDLNFTGNLSDGGFHGENQGWSTFETSIADVFYELGVPWANAINMAEEIILRRYGDSPTAGGPEDTYDESLASGASGIDHDGSGDLDNFDPYWFSEWRPRIEFGSYPVLPHDPFDAETLEADLKALHADFTTYWDLIEDYITAGTRSSGELGQYLNLNAVESAGTLFNWMGLSAGTFAQKAVNIIDYRDANDWVTEFSAPDGNTYYGVESILINEVLANSHADYPDFELNVDYDNSSAGPELVDGNLPPGTAFRMKIYFSWSTVSPPTDITITIHGEEDYQPAPFALTPSLVTPPVNSSDAGELSLSLQMTPQTEDSTASITRVELLCAEFVELINIGEDAVDVSGWVIEVDGDRRDIPLTAGEIDSGDYLVLTNDLELFEASYGTGLNAFQIDGWNRYPAGVEFEDATNFNNGDVDLLLYIDYTPPDEYLLADIAVHGSGTENVFGADVANTSRPGPSGGIGISREKNDPAVRGDWQDNLDSGASPGDHNSRLDQDAENILDGLYGGTHPPLVANRPFASVAAVMSIPAMDYAGVRSGDSARPWEAISDGTFSSIASRCSAYYIRLDAERAEVAPAGIDGIWEWQDIRLDPGIEYDLYIYGLYSGTAGDDLTVIIEEEDPDTGIVSDREFDVRYEQSDGAYVTRIDGRHIDNDDGSLRLELQRIEPVVVFDYLMLVPDGVPGKININTAEGEVLMGLPGITGPLANAIINNRPYGNTGELLRAFPDPDSAELFAPVANLVTVALLGPGGPSDTYRIISTGRNVGPMGDATSVRRIEMTVRLSGDDVSVLSWKYAY